ncbi:MAG TPA: flagellar basal-body rod protein FlgF [Pyrinomonadaceae bacterium]|nr:flagellar basal-body rod protein FlgF [Pyrinomonadaceae bacterium]
MNSDAYIVYQGMRARQRALDVIANNIANASTSGFKADRLLYRSFEAAEQEAQANAAPDPAGAASPNTTAAAATESKPTDEVDAARLKREMNIVTSGATDFSQGSIRQTGRSLDVALNGDGFFAVQTPRGERYTRAGSFALDAAGQLVTQNGDLVLGSGGPITVPPGEISFGADGTISAGGKNFDRLKIVRFNDARAALVKEGSALFAAADGVRPREDNRTGVEGGALEMSNVNTLTEMAAMMQNGREFESLQKSISLMMNDLGRKVATEIGRI